jgi:hypothetical protein
MAIRSGGVHDNSRSHALGPPPGETTHWTGRMLAKALGGSLRSVQRILEAHNSRRIESARSSCRTTRSSPRNKRGVFRSVVDP